MNALDEKRKTASNVKAEIMDARVIANYGDPGLNEDYQFDLLSQYVVVMIESTYRIPTQDKWWKMLAIVQRPKHLWITTNQVTTPTTQQRMDAEGNVNVGLSSAYSVNGIQTINDPYSLGEKIKIRRLSTPFTKAVTPTFFSSQFLNWSAAIAAYGGWHNQGSTLPYINQDPNKVAGLQTKTIIPTSNNLFNFIVTKYQYEAAMLSIADPTLNATMTQIFAGTWQGSTPVYSANGGYIFNNSPAVEMAACEYEDINIGNKYRINSSSCIPLVVATPNSFPTPKSRGAGTISYTPTYSPIAR